MSQNMDDLLDDNINKYEEKIQEENEQDERGSPQNQNVDLEYGDIIQLISPTNAEYHESVFFVNYIDETKLKIINVANNEIFMLAIKEDGSGFTDESILSIYLLDRSKESGYARQKKLLPGVWVDIHFANMVSPVITAEITGLDEDQIELTTYPQLKQIYIDFAYCGVPEDIPIEKFVIREKPHTLKNASSLSILREQVAEQEEYDVYNPLKDEQQKDDEDEEEPFVSIHDALREEYMKTQPKKRGIVFGEYLEEVEQFVEVAENKKRYNIEVQINSYMDELLSTIPYSARTTAVMTRIHILVERFKELRELYSEFDPTGNIKWLKKTDPTTHKPLIPRIQKMDVKLPWIVPIVSNTKKIYQEADKLGETYTSDIFKYTDDLAIAEESNMINDLYYSAANEQNKYVTLYDQLNENFMTPAFPPANDHEIMKQIPVGITTETFVQNSRNIYSNAISHNEIESHRFHKQVYTEPQYYMAKELRFNDKNHYVQRRLMNADTMYLQSILTLPMPVVQYSRAFLPSTSIIDRVQLSLMPYMPSFFLNKRTKVKTVQISDFSKELEFELKDDSKKSTGKFQYLNTITQYILNHNLLEDENKFDKFLQVVVPNTWVVIRFLNQYMKDAYSFQDIISVLEPYMIYDKDISYTQYKEIRYMIREKIKELKQVLQTKIIDFGKYKNYKYNVNQLQEILPNIFVEKGDLADLLDVGYKLDIKNGENIDKKPIGRKKTTDEMLHHILSTDDAELFALLMQSIMIMLVTPAAILNIDSQQEDWMDADKKRDCATQVLAKKYMKIDDLIKDNGQEDVFFDKELDETNYDIMKKYEKEKKEMIDNVKFTEFLQENLVQNHGISREHAPELAQILIVGKKRVKEGEYAVLQMTPTVSLPPQSEEEQIDIETETEIRTKYTYYVRKKNQWVHDESLDEMAFQDSNTLFCNLKNIGCFKDNSSSSTEKACEHGPSYFYQLERKRVLKEFDRRYEHSRESLQQSLEYRIAKQTRIASRLQTLRDIQLNKPNLLAYNLGLRAQHIADDLVVSPRAQLIRAIYGQKDFIDKQRNIVKFVEKYCREPMISERDEDAYWKYCIDTNTKLVPSFMYLLANEFVHFGQEAYINKLNEIISVQGKEEDGYIYDQYTHEVIKKIDNVEEDQYNEAGFRVITNAVIEPDVGSIVREKLTKKKERVFENVLSEEIYKIYAAISSKITPFSEEVWETVNQLSTEFANNPKIINTEKDYEAKRILAEKKQQGKNGIPYEKMRNKKLIQIVSSVLFIVIQTAIPHFKGKKTFPGCVLSFDGFPLTGEENLSGIKYIVCILKGISSSDIKPWNSIHKVGPELMLKQIQEIMKSHMLEHPKINALYEAKREHMLFTLDIEPVPHEHRLDKWQHFLPPLVETTVIKGLQPIGSGYVKEFWSLMRKGHKDQSNYEVAIKSKMAQYGYAIIEKIQDIVKTKTLLLKTSGNVPYLQNACCNDTLLAIGYFINEDGSPISQYFRSVGELSRMTHRVHIFTRAAFLRNVFSFVPKPILPTELMEENMYAAMIHYCGLDRDNIPMEFRGFFTEIPEGYHANMSLIEKVGVIKRRKRLDKEDMDHLMRIVRQKNHVDIWQSPIPNIIESFQDMLTVFDDHADNLTVDEEIRATIRQILEYYNPNIMQSVLDTEKPVIKLLETLKRNLYEANETLLGNILRFLEKSLKWNKKTAKYQEIAQFLENIHIWNIDAPTKTRGYYDSAFYRVQQYFKNALYDLTHYLPGLMLNRGNNNDALNYYQNEKGGVRKKKSSDSKNVRIHRYWNLSRYDETDLLATIQKYQQELYAFQEDDVLIELIRTIHPKLIDLNSWISEMPVFSSLMKDREYFHLFDKSTIQNIDTYLLYTSIYEYIKGIGDHVILQKERQTKKEKRRANIQENEDVFLPGTSEQNMEDDDVLDEFNELQEVDFMVDENQQKDLNERVGNFIMVFLNMYKENKKKTDYTYVEIERNMNKERTKEKERIMQRFTVDERGNQKKEEERNIEYAKKKLGLGIWNVGKQKGIFKYDKETSNRERDEIQKQIQQECEESVEEIVNQDYSIEEVGMSTIEEIEEEQEEDEEKEIENEMYNISGYRGEDYSNGVYYEDDREENVFNEDD